jgi:hypothetical protein
VQEGSSPLGLGGSLLEVDTTAPVEVAQVAAWVRSCPEFQPLG